MQRRKQKESSNIVYLKIFLIFVIVCILISLFLKLSNLVNTSSFDPNYFNMVLIGEKVFLFNIRQNANKINSVEIKNSDINKFKRLTRYQMSTAFTVPVNAVFIDKINYDKSRLNRDKIGIKRYNNPRDIFSLGNTIKYILMPSIYSSSGLNSLDILKIYFVFSSVSGSDFTSGTYDMQGKDDALNNSMYNYFKDENIINDGVSVEVVNGSGVDGAASKIAQILKNNGFNIVSITSSDKEYKLSNIICRTAENYSTQKIEKIFSTSISCGQGIGIADISIILGKDYRLDFCSYLSPCDN